MMRIAPRFRFVAMLLPMLGSLPGCAQTQSWDDYASKTETMKFFTFVPCDTWFLATPPEHQVYFHVTSMADYDDGSYRVEYQRRSQWVYERLYFRSVDYIGLRDYTAISTVWMPSDTGARCAALVVLPWSSESERPFYPVEKGAGDAAGRSLFVSALVGIGVFGALLLLWRGGMKGFLDNEADEKALCTAFLLAVLALNGIVWAVNFSALSNIDALNSYYAFYDALPKSDGHLLPLEWSQAHRLFDGPPHPASVVVDAGLFWMVLSLSTAAWLAMYARRIFIGIDYATMSDPFEELRERLAAEGRVPTPDDYLGVLMQAGAAMDARELALLKRRMKERFPDA
jgi:hypothetical protein